ncbi:MAG TPA: hypothetical protein VFG84_00410 [Gemmatimonadaceae bacterium]|nr:hypothetical protein [Gemmatimonadaceae bacterium]
MTTRRYGDDEAREIFSLATTGSAPGQELTVESGGLTLDQLQRIGEEAGIEPSRVARAAARLDARGRPAPVRRSLGLPIELSRVVDLPRAPTDREWEQLISQFRTTIGGPGQSTVSGGLREWTYGDLHICVEPTERGEQLRIGTVNSGGMALNGLGIATGLMATLMGAAVAAAGKPDKALVVFGMFGGIALAAFGANLLRSPRWAREHERQMEEVAENAVKLLSKP